MTGFGVFTPISVRFDAPLDLDNIAQRHADDYDTSDDALFLIDVTPGSPTYGQPVELDIGHGRLEACTKIGDVLFSHFFSGNYPANRCFKSGK